MLTLKGRNEEKVRFSAEHLRRRLDELTAPESGKAPKPESEARQFELGADKAPPTRSPAPSPAHPLRDLIIAGPAPSPLLRAETYYRYQIMLRVQRMTVLSQRLAQLIQSLPLPEDVSLSVDIDPVDLA